VETLLDELRLYSIEMVGVIYEEYGVFYNRKQIHKALRKRGWTGKVLQRHALEQDADLRNVYQITIGRFPPETLLFVDETHCDRKTYRRKYGYSRRGTPAWKRVRFNQRRAGSASVSGIATISIQGIMSVTVYDYIVDGDVFIQALVNDIFPIMNPFPGPRSVLVMDNAPVHRKNHIYALAFEQGVIVIFLPPYSYDFNPIELAFKDAKARMQREYGLDEGGNDITLADMLETGIRNACSVDVACNHFQHCYIGVSDLTRAWAKDN